MKSVVFTTLSIFSLFKRRITSQYLKYAIAGLSVVPFANCTKNANSTKEYIVIFTEVFTQQKFGTDTTGISQYLHAFIKEKRIPSRNYISYTYAFKPNTSLYLLIRLNEVEVKRLQSEDIIQSVIPNKEFLGIGTDSSPQ